MSTIDPLPARRFAERRADKSAVVRYGQEFFRTRRVSKGTSQLALEQLGTRGAVELGLVCPDVNGAGSQWHLLERLAWRFAVGWVEALPADTHQGRGLDRWVSLTLNPSYGVLTA